MLPQSYELPAAIVLVLAGALSCVAGYRLFKFVLGLYGFVLGAMLASSAMGVTNTTGMIVASLVGGICGALLLMFAYFVGIALVGAGLGALIAHVAWSSVGKGGDPPAMAVVVLSILGSIGAMFLQRYVIIVSTAFGGAWTAIVGALAIAGERSAAAKAAAATDVWILYPTSPAPGQAWVPVAWILLGLIGTGVQLGITGRKRT
ncbi:MAG: hypothetical protein JWL71_3194 [Acidobacteria bacterium]|nr:hypothetical protein [Acidobacteriota bacterium]